MEKETSKGEEGLLGGWSIRWNNLLSFNVQSEEVEKNAGNRSRPKNHTINKL